MLKSTMAQMGAGARIAHHGPRIDRSMLQLETEYTCAVVPKKPKNGQLANEEGSIYGFPACYAAGVRANSVRFGCKKLGLTRELHGVATICCQAFESRAARLTSS